MRNLLLKIAGLMLGRISNPEILQPPLPSNVIVHEAIPSIHS